MITEIIESEPKFKTYQSITIWGTWRLSIYPKLEETLLWIGLFRRKYKLILWDNIDYVEVLYLKKAYLWTVKWSTLTKNCEDCVNLSPSKTNYMTETLNRLKNRWNIFNYSRSIKQYTLTRLRLKLFFLCNHINEASISKDPKKEIDNFIGDNNQLVDSPEHAVHLLEDEWSELKFDISLVRHISCETQNVGNIQKTFDKMEPWEKTGEEWGFLLWVTSIHSRTVDYNYTRSGRVLFSQWH